MVSITLSLRDVAELSKKSAFFYAIKQSWTARVDHSDGLQPQLLSAHKLRVLNSEPEEPQTFNS